MSIPVNARKNPANPNSSEKKRSTGLNGPSNNFKQKKK